MLSKRAGRERGFTLIELVILCGISSILVALIMSIVSSVHQTERRVVCTSNLRQIGVAIHAYAAENRGEIPAVYGRDGARLRATAWTNVAVDERDKGIGGLLLLFGKPFGDPAHPF